MPSDTYILTISDAGVSVPSSHASTHISGGSDAIPTATSSASGLMSAAIFDQHVINTAKVSNRTHTGDVFDSSGVLTVTKINGVRLSELETGILKNTTGTGQPSIAVAADFPTLNQNTTGNAATATTATNIAGGAVGTIPYQTGSGATTMLDAGTAGYVLKSNGSAAPSWAPVDLSAGVSGSLPVSSGGTGAATFTAGVLKANGTSSFTTVTAPTGDLVGTTDTQTLTNKVFGSGTTFSDTIGVASGGTGAATFTAGVLKANGTSSFTTVTAPTGDLVGTTDAQTLTNKTLGSGTVLSGTLVSLTSNVTGTLPVANGGTGAVTLTGYVKGTGTTAMTANATVPVADISGTLPVANGGTGVTNSTGSGANVLATSPVLVTPQLGTPTSGTLTSCTGLPLTTGVTGILPIANGGTANDGTAVSAITFDTLKFKTTGQTTSDLTEGQARWNSTERTLDLKMAGDNVTQQVGQELLMRVHAAETIFNGEVVYISGSNSGLPAVSKASANSITSRKTLAVATEDIDVGNDGYVTLYGLVRGLDLSAYTAGQELWLANDGLFTGTEAAYPNYKVRIGFVIVASDGTGVLYASPKFYENGYVNGTGKIGYITGAGGTVTQSTNKGTGVTLDKTNGQITMNAAALSANTTVSFTLTNSKIEAGDVLILNHISGGTNFGSYVLNARSAAGSAIIDVHNVTNSSLSEAIVIAFAVIKAVTT